MLTEPRIMIVGRFSTSRFVPTSFVLTVVSMADSVTPLVWQSEKTVGTMDEGDWLLVVTVVVLRWWWWNGVEFRNDTCGFFCVCPWSVVCRISPSLPESLHSPFFRFYFFGGDVSTSLLTFWRHTTHLFSLQARGAVSG